MHVVGDHQAGDLFLGHNALGQLQHLLRRGRVQGGSVLVQQQELGGNKGGHEQGQRLPLAAREQTHRLLHPILKAHVQQGKFFPEQLLILAGDAGEDSVGGGSCPEIGQRKVFLNGHIGGRALEGVLEQVADDLAALILRRKGNVLPAQHDAALVGNETAGDGVEHGGFARAVGAHDGGKVARLHVQAHTVQGHLFVDGAGVKGLVQIVQFQHFHLSAPPSGHCACAAQRQTLPGWRASRWPQPR